MHCLKGILVSGGIKRTIVASIRTILLSLIALAFLGSGPIRHARAGWGDGGGPGWAELWPLTIPRADLAVTAGSDTKGNPAIYAIGGSSVPKGIVISPSPVEAYDPMNNSWSQLSPLNHARDQLAAVSLNGTIYAVGGWGPLANTTGTDATYLSFVEAYDPTHPEAGWTDRTPMPTARRNLAVVASNDKIYAIGGCCSAAPSPGYDIVEVYNPALDPLADPSVDPNSNPWTQGPSLTEQRTKLAAAVDPTTGTIYALGGVACPPGASGCLGRSEPDVESFNPGSDSQWSPALALHEAREQLKAVVTDDGRIFAVGGTRSLCENQASCRPYSVDSWAQGQSEWSFFALMPSSRSIFGAAYSNGYIYVVGGSDGNQAVSATQRIRVPTVSPASMTAP
jgi:hypothetical protein